MNDPDILLWGIYPNKTIVEKSHGRQPSLWPWFILAIIASSTISTLDSFRDIMQKVGGGYITASTVETMAFAVS